MRRILFILMMMISGISLSQSTVNPDTVCYQSATPSTYTIPSVGSGTYTWTITSPGVITTGQGTNSISVDWSTASPGLITNGVSVTYTTPTPSSCPTDPITLNVLIYQVVPTITTTGPFCETDPCLTLVGSPSGGSWSGTGVTGNQFCPDNVANGSNAIANVTYTITAGGCTFSNNGTIPVYGKPTLSPIQHN
jgi:hypothetical protein